MFMQQRYAHLSVYRMFGLLRASVDYKLLWVPFLYPLNMQTAVIKFYKVPHFILGSDWYKIALLIQRGKSSNMYILKTCDRKVLDALNSSCPKEIRGELCKIAKKLMSSTHLISIAFYSLYTHVAPKQCRMKNYHKIYIL